MLAASGCGRLLYSISKRFGTKFLAHADPDGIANTGLCSNSQRHPYRDSEGADAHQSESNSHSNSAFEPDTNADAGQPDTNSYAYTRRKWKTLKAKPASFGLAGVG
ncbi:MAG TPA: hypothetical protein VGQ12_00385 [Candidatus Angelobacter sp.]|nr:hypothetical protein [Candidatus Angelobacter sp.]